MSKVLLVTPNLKIHGGVCEFNKMLLQYSSSDITPFILSTAGKNQAIIIKSLLVSFDIVHFTFLLVFNKYRIIHLGPSLTSNSIKRDGIFCWIAKRMGKQVYIHWHGWNPSHEYLLHSRLNIFFKKTFFKADHIKFLSASFQKQFIKCGYKNATSLGNTFVNNNLVENFTLQPRQNKELTILFLSAISKNKGIYIALEVFNQLATKYNLKFVIAGDGDELENIRKSLDDRYLERIELTGYVCGNNKIELFRNADIYLFPSYYEGMPTSLLEAMAFGLPIVCSSVGAIPDFFINETMGYMIKDFNANSYTQALEKLILRKELRDKIGLYNYNYALNNFLASASVLKIDEDYKSLMK